MPPAHHYPRGTCLGNGEHVNSESTLDDAAERAAAREEAKRFIAVVYGDPAAIAAWATLPDGGGSSPLGPQRFFGRLDDVFDRLWEARRAGHGVFTTLNLTDGQGFKSEHIVRVRFVWADEDEKDGRLPVDASALVPPPTMVIRSGGGRHIYWAVDDARLEEFTRAQKGIAASLVTDPRVSDPLPWVSTPEGPRKPEACLHRAGERSALHASGSDGRPGARLGDG